ncbi:MAG: DHH family phosphoesterase [Oscillospiraceae bacterium]
MRQKAALYKPMLAIIVTALVALCTVAYLFNVRAFYIAVFVSGIALAALILILIRSGRDIDRFVTQVGEAIGAMQADTLLRFPMPVLVTDVAGQILWYNELFKQKVLQSREKGDVWYGRPILERMKGLDTTRSVQNLTCEGRDYSVFRAESSHQDHPVVTYYLVDDGDLKRDAVQYHLSRPSILMIMIDSLEELLQNARENERSNLISQIEYRIEKFASDHDGIVIKTERDRFVLLIEERHMPGIVEKRFELLDEVRELSAGDKLPVTLSIGVSRNIESYPEGEQAARQALDMAQGRGGDQAALKTQAGYDFFGGLSKGIEKRTKVKTRIVATALAELIESSRNVVIMGHKYADLDCLGATVGLMKAIRQMGKPCTVAISRTRNLVPSLIERLEQHGYADSFLEPSEVQGIVGAETLLIIVDTHLVHVVESSDLYQACKNNVVVIDHHRRMVGYIDNAVIFYHEPFASSASEMVTELVQYFGEKNHIGRMEAEALLAGIMLDTKNFTIRTGVRTFEAAAYLRRQGADTVEVRKMFSSTMESYQRRARVVSSAEVYHRCAIACTATTADDIKLVAPQAADELLNISGVDASFVLYEYDGGISISARSMGKFNVQVIMEALGGGGHQTMAATQMPEISMEDARQKLLDAIEEYNHNNKQGS